MLSSQHGDWGDTTDDGSELVRSLPQLVTGGPEAYSEESDELVMVSECGYHSGVSVRTAVSFSAAAQKNLPKEDIPEEVSLKRNIFITRM